jgi:hypothetical protein
VLNSKITLKFLLVVLIALSNMINFSTSAKASIINDSYLWADNGNGTANLNINFTPDATDPL